MDVKSAESGIPVLVQVDDEVTVIDPVSKENRHLRQYDRIGRWTLMAILNP